MAGKVECACGKQYTWKPELAGKRARCKACGNVVSFPATDPSDELDPFATDDVPPPPPPPGFGDTYAEAAPPPPPPPPPPGAHAPPVPIAGATSVGEGGAKGGFSWGVLVNILIGVGLIGFAVWQFNHIAEAEALGETPRFGRKGGILRLLYGMGGKWLVVGAFGGLGAAMAIGGVLVMLGKKKPAAASADE